MAKKTEPPNSIVWNIYKTDNKTSWLGEVEASDKTTAIVKAAA
jgi:hypothetical protein